MTKWRNHLEIKTIWEQCENDEISVYELAQGITKGLRGIYPVKPTRMYPEDYDELCGIILAFEELPEDADEDDIDSVMYDLYNWADYNKLWVATTF